VLLVGDRDQQHPRILHQVVDEMPVILSVEQDVILLYITYFGTTTLLGIMK
jgi:hypothetical protein